MGCYPKRQPDASVDRFDDQHHLAAGQRAVLTISTSNQPRPHSHRISTIHCPVARPISVSSTTMAGGSSSMRCGNFLLNTSGT